MLLFSKVEKIEKNQSEQYENIHGTIPIYFCEFCDLEFDSKIKLREHRKESRCNLFKCSICNFSTAEETIIK